MQLGRIVGGLVAAGGVAVFGATGSFDDNTTRNEQGEITEAGGVGVFVLEVGDCVQLPGMDATEVQSLEGVPCDEPHDAQVFAEFDMEDGPYPADAVLQQTALDGCEFNWAPAFGVPHSSMPDKDAYYFYPLAEGWAAGDHEVQCLVISMDGSKLVGSLLPS